MKIFGAGLFFALTIATAALAEPNAERWKTHLTNDLLPFWDDPYAAGTPAGSFAGNLCNDGSAPVAGVSCSGVSASLASNPQQTLVGQARQVFSYAIAFHMTGQKTYLDLAKAGLDYQWDTFHDADTGLFHEVHNVNTGTVSGVFNSQKQAYGLLGASFLYYLTGDEVIYDRIKPVETAITASYRDPATGGYSSRPIYTDPANRIAFHLDQLNSYKTLLAANAPLADKAGFLAEALQTANFIKDEFYDSATGLIRPRLDTPAGTMENADFAHSVKSFWFIDQTAQLAGDDALASFAQDAAKALFKQAYQEDLKAWATNHDASGDLSTRTHWWGFAELNQYAASLAISDPELRDMLTSTQSYWLDMFVDPDNAGIWGYVDIATGTPETEYRKHWEWKAGFHSYEHALINYLADAGIAGEEVTLYFAREDLTDLPLAYGFDADLMADAADEDGITRARLSGVNFAAAIAPVPLPASFALLLCAVLGLRRLARPVTG